MNKSLDELIQLYNEELRVILTERDAHQFRMNEIDIRITQIVGAKEALEALVKSLSTEKNAINGDSSTQEPLL